MPKLITIFALSTVLLVADDKKKNDKKPKSGDKKEAKTSVEKQDSVTIDGKKIDYRVTAATLKLKNEKSEDRASIFHVAYQRLGIKDKAKRPVVFCFNGGPGSSAVWLHLGGVGPRLVPTAEDGTKTLPPPRELIENPHSILDIADLVFIDPVATGYSRIEEKGKKGDFHGVNGDIESVGDFIRRWVSENDRWASPKFLLGESYGGIRAAGLSEHLQSRYGMTLNGTVMLSSLLDYRTLRGGQGDDFSNAIFLPAFTAVAHHHKKITGDRAALYQKARDYARQEYFPLLMRGTTLSNEEIEAAAQKLSQLSGISAELWKENHLRISPSRFRKELLRSEGKTIGRFDGRVAWPSVSPQDDYPDYDPSYAVVYGAFATAMNDYLSRDLGWEGHHPYEILTRKVHPWNWNANNSIVNLTGRLARAMRDNPDLRILVMCGYTDLATPPTGIIQSFNQAYQIPAPQRSLIEYTWYDAGHMFYLNQPDLVKMRKDLVEFITK